MPVKPEANPHCQRAAPAVFVQGQQELDRMYKMWTFAQQPLPFPRGHTSVGWFEMSIPWCVT